MFRKDSLWDCLLGAGERGCVKDGRPGGGPARALWWRGPASWHNFPVRKRSDGPLRRVEGETSLVPPVVGRRASCRGVCLPLSPASLTTYLGPLLGATAVATSVPSAGDGHGAERRTGSSLVRHSRPCACSGSCGLACVERLKGARGGGRPAAGCLGVRARLRTRTAGLVVEG